MMYNMVQSPYKSDDNNKILKRAVGSENYNNVKMDVFNVKINCIGLVIYKCMGEYKIYYNLGIFISVVEK